MKNNYKINLVTIISQSDLHQIFVNYSTHFYTEVKTNIASHTNRYQKLTKLFIKMNETKHIHEVIFLVDEHKDEWTIEELFENIRKNWGEDIQFSACSGGAIPVENTFEFLENRRKLVVSEEGKVTLHPFIQICNGHKN